MYVDRYAQIMSWAAAIIGVVAEGVMLWLFELLPLWAQLLICVPPGILFALGIFFIVQDKLRARRRKRLAAEARVSPARRG